MSATPSGENSRGQSWRVETDKSNQGKGNQGMANNASTRSSNGRTGNRIVSATPLASRAYGGGSNTAILSRVRWAFMPPANDNRRPLVRTLHLALSRVILPATIIGLIFYWQFG